MTASPANRNYRCASGEIAVNITNAEQWHALVVCLGRPELAYDGSWEAVRKAEADGPTAAVVEEMFGEDIATSWAQRLEAHGVPFKLVK